MLTCRYAAPLITVNLVPRGAGALVCSKVGTAEVVTGEGPLGGALSAICHDTQTYLLDYSHNYEHTLSHTH